MIVDAFGLRIEGRADAPLYASLIAPFFVGFPRSEGAADVDLCVALRQGLVDTRDVDLVSAGYRRALFHNALFGFERDGAFVLLEQGVRVDVSEDGRSITAVVDPDRFDARLFVRTTLFVAFAIALRHRRLFHLHAGAVERASQRVLVMGDSGAGKTTVTLALLDATAKHLGDDTLFLAEDDGRAILHGFPRPFHLGPKTLAAFPSLCAAPEEDGVEKRSVDTEALPGRVVDRLEAPHLVLFPQVTDARTTRAIALPRADAFGLALRSSALVVVDGMKHPGDQLRLLAALLSPARAYELHLGADWLADPEEAVSRLPW